MGPSRPNFNPRRKKKCVRVLENTAWHRTGHARFIFQCVGCWKGWRSSNSIPIPTETNQLSNGIPQCMFIIIIIFIVPCLTIIHGYKQSLASVLVRVCVWVCVIQCIFISLSRTNCATPDFGFVFLYYHVCMDDSLTSCTRFCPSFFSTLTSFNKPSF